MRALEYALTAVAGIAVAVAIGAFVKMYFTLILEIGNLVL